MYSTWKGEKKLDALKKVAKDCNLIVLQIEHHFSPVPHFLTRKEKLKTKIWSESRIGPLKEIFQTFQFDFENLSKN